MFPLMVQQSEKPGRWERREHAWVARPFQQAVKPQSVLDWWQLKKTASIMLFKIITHSVLNSVMHWHLKPTNYTAD